ncbi:MAG: hypothetical protein HYU63_02945 [Armatimonadetes bacterium]|nr:hypothetical protein [Armatimonadota bacterium]
MEEDFLEEKISAELKEELDYLEEILSEYEKYVRNIGDLKETAVMLLYYRDEAQESLDYLKYEKIELKDYWRKVVELDNILRSKVLIFVHEVGYNNFKQYQIINDPPKTYWWWYLNKSAPPVIGEKKFWEFWKV